jgi:hypothetical protein
LIVEWAILIAVALLVLIIGRWILRMVRNAVEKLLGADWMDGVWERSGVKSALGSSEQTPASIAATVLYAYLMIGLLLIVTRILRLGTIEDLLERLLLWVPQLLLAAIIVIVAAAAGTWTAGLVKPFADDKGVGWLTGLVRVAIIVFGVIFALDVVNITFAEDITKILVAAAGVALAIAFGVGGIDAGKQWWSRYATPDKLGSGGSGQQG